MSTENNLSKYSIDGRLRADGRNGYHLHINVIIEADTGKETGITITKEQINRKSSWTQKILFKEFEYPTIKEAIEVYERAK